MLVWNMGVPYIPADREDGDSDEDVYPQHSPESPDSNTDCTKELEPPDINVDVAEMEPPDINVDGAEMEPPDSNFEPDNDNFLPVFPLKRYFHVGFI